jgi:hypothetical protein
MDIFTKSVSGAAGYDVPPHTMDSLRHYLIQGWDPGGFVTSVLALDMSRSIASADVGNRHRLWSISRWIMEYAPPESWGSYEAVDLWCKDQDSRRSKWAVWYELNKSEDDVEEPLF